MVYIKRISGDIVQLGGMVASDSMLEEGWFEYEGEIPQGTNFKLVDNVLTAFVPEKTDYEKYTDYKAYLNNTDHKMYIDYTPKDGEDLNAIKAERSVAREFCRTYEASRITKMPGTGSPL